MFAKYNLYVGNECTSVSSYTPYGNEAIGIQDSTMLESKGQNTRKGVVAFSLTNYWKSDTYPLYVCDSNSIVYEYVE